MGRWLSPDWAEKATAVPYANFSDPRTLNLYGYVRNNPLTGVDADGHAPGDEYRKVQEAAADAIKDSKSSPHGHKYEYGGRIYLNPNGTFSYTAPRTNNDSQHVDPGPLQKNTVGDYHIHPESERNNPDSERVVRSGDPISARNDADDVRRMNGEKPQEVSDYKSFVGTPSGKMLELTPNSKAQDANGLPAIVDVKTYKPSDVQKLEGKALPK